MLRRMSPQQLFLWMAFEQIEPFEEYRADVRAAQAAALLANINRDPKKRVEPFKIEDFLLKFGDPEPVKRTQSPQMQMSLLMAIAEAWTAPGKGPADNV